MQDLISALSASVDPAALMRRIAEQMCVVTPKADGAAVSMLTADDTFVVVSAHGLVKSLLGFAFPREGTFVGAAIATGRPQVSGNAPSDAALLDHVRDTATALGVGSLAVIPLMHRGSAIGALSMSAVESNKFGERDVGAMEATGQFISALISSHTELTSLIDDYLTDPRTTGQDAAARFLASLLLPEVAHHEHMHRRLDDVLDNPSHLTAVLQPIVDMGTGSVVGYEGLSRFPADPDLTPWQWFDLARRLGRSQPLELEAIQGVLAAAEEIPARYFIAVNVSPVTVMDPAVQATLLAVQRPLVVEITEHEPFPDALSHSVTPLRDRGIHLAIDDAGAGYASFTQLLRLRPDIIKIDGSLTDGIADDPVKRALASAIVKLADELDATTVAEAVENCDQQEALRTLGIDWGQGFLFGRPAPHLDHPGADAVAL